MKIQKIGEKFKELINSTPTLEFKSVDHQSLPDHAKLVVFSILKPFKISWEIAQVQIDGFVCLRISDPKYPYVDIGPDSYMWCTEGHEDSADPDEVIVYLLKKYRGIDIIVHNDKTVSLIKPPV